MDTATNSHTTTLFHFTRGNRERNGQEVIMQILKEGFKFAYCAEHFGDEFLAIPMVCFCDIPISRCTEHSEKYGEQAAAYAIGLDKRWFTQVREVYPNALGPVHYIVDDAVYECGMHIRQEALLSCAEAYMIFKKASQTRDNWPAKIRDNHETRYVSENEELRYNKAVKNASAYFKYASHTLGFIKPFTSVNSQKKTVINYDECEWRVILVDRTQLESGDVIRWFDSPDEYDKYRGNKETNPKKFIDGTAFLFGPEAIKYILVPKYDDIPQMVENIQSLDKVCHTDLDNNSKALLCSKIISFEQIKADF